VAVPFGLLQQQADALEGHKRQLSSAIPCHERPTAERMMTPHKVRDVAVATSLDDATLVPILFVRNGMQGQPQEE